MPIAAISLVLAGIKGALWIYQTFWGAAPRLEAKERYWSEKQALAKAERARLQETNKKIDAAPPKTGDDLEKGINDAWNRKP